MAVELTNGLKYLDQRKLYGLKPDEQIICSRTYSQGWRSRRIPQKEIGVSSEFNKAHQEAVETARRIEAGPKVDPIAEGLGSMSSEQELQGCFKDIRVVVMKDVVAGHRMKGFTLIGVQR